MTSQQQPPLPWPPVSYWMKVAAGVIVVFGVANMIVEIKHVLILILVSLILAIGFQPAVTWLTTRGFKRGLAVATIALTGFAVIGGFLALILPTIISQVGELVVKAPEYVRRAQEGSGFISELNERFGLTTRLQSLAGEVPSTALSLVKSFTSFLFNTITVVILTLYFTTALPRMRHGLASLLTRENRASFEAILEESTQRVGGYLIGNLVISLIAGVLAFIALVVMQVPYPAALAFWVALTDLIPTVGAFLGMGLAAAVAAFAGVPQLIATVVYFTVYQQIENYVIAPRVMRRAIEMSAATIIVALLIGGSLLGFVGALLALPMAAMIKIVVQKLYVQDRIEEVRANDEAATAPPAPPPASPPSRRRGVVARAKGRLRRRS